MTFFNPKTGETFDGSYPFVHWTEPLSTGVIRYKSLYFLADKASVRVTMDVPENWVFALYNPKAFSKLTEIDGFRFGDLNVVTGNDITLSGQKMEGQYTYQLIIVCKSEVEGEFIEDFFIDGNAYKIGAQFWGENETVRINLLNQGTELPNIIYKAICGADIHEDGTDWVLFNRKLKELLVNHMEIMDNKGSYKSLFNALQWFEYANLVELREIWKFQTPIGTKYIDSEVAAVANESTKKLTFSAAKTTYFGLRQPSAVPTGKVGDPAFIDTLYGKDEDDNEVVAEGQLFTEWERQEMVVKMMMLGYFFERYFMPVHSELAYSAVEDQCVNNLTIYYSAVGYQHTS